MLSAHKLRVFVVEHLLHHN